MPVVGRCSWSLARSKFLPPMTTLRKDQIPQPDRRVWNLYTGSLRHWPLVVVVSLIGVAGGYLYGQRYRPVFHSEAQVRVGDMLDARSVPAARDDGSSLTTSPPPSGRGCWSMPKTQTDGGGAYAPTGAVAPRGLASTDGREELIDHIKRLAQVDAVTRRVYRISYDAKDPDLAQQVVQGMAEIGVADVIAQRNQSAGRRASSSPAKPIAPASA